MTSRWKRCSPLLVGLWLVAAAALSQGILPLGPEFQVNSYTTSEQALPAVTAAGTNFVIAWRSDGSSGDDSAGFSIQARLVDAGGNPAGPDFQVNTYTTTDQAGPAVAADGVGNFVVVWHGNGSGGDDSSYLSVHARRFDASANPLGPEFQVNTYTTDYQLSPAVAADAAGDFVIVWQSYGSSGDDADGYSIQARRFTAAGSPLGSEVQVNSYTTSSQTSAAVSFQPGGSFVVVWASNGSSGDDTDSLSIQGRRFDADGDPMGPDFQVNTYTTSYQRSPSVASDPAGNFVVVWESSGSSGGDSSGSSIQARRFDAAGNPQGPEFQVNSYTTSGQQLATVAADVTGRFVVAWHSFGSSGGDSSGSSVQARHFDATGTPLGPDFQVNTYTTSYQRSPSVTADSAGDFVVAWQSSGSNGDDSSGYSIQARRYRAPFFADGFETGDTSAWSATVP